MISHSVDKCQGVQVHRNSAGPGHQQTRLDSTPEYLETGYQQHAGQVHEHFHGYHDHPYCCFTTYIRVAVGAVVRISAMEINVRSVKRFKQIACDNACANQGKTTVLPQYTFYFFGIDRGNA
ncbi:hypothetical protein D3C84_1008530 [compost metagenome]